MNEEDKQWRAVFLPLREEIARAAANTNSASHLLAAFRQMRASSHRRNARRKRIAWAAAAAIAAGVVLFFAAHRPVPPPVLQARIIVPPAAPVLAPSSPAPKPHRARRAPSITFYALHVPGANLPIERGQVVRVVLPGLSLAEAGVPVSPDRWFENVLADVLFAEDGSARAARIVPQTASWRQ